MLMSNVSLAAPGGKLREHIIVLNAAHLCRTLKTYEKHYNSARAHLSLEKNAPVLRPTSSSGAIKSSPHLGGLHHQHTRI
jgi:hypothetical protein